VKKDVILQKLCKSFLELNYIALYINMEQPFSTRAESAVMIKKMMEQASFI